jgi:hypothetical protein
MGLSFIGGTVPHNHWLSLFSPATLAAVSELLGVRLRHSSTAARRALTGFAYLLSAIPQVLVQLS